MGELSKVNKSLLTELKIISGGDLATSFGGVSDLGEKCTKAHSSSS